jgi:hypothetical protein
MNRLFLSPTLALLLAPITIQAQTFDVGQDEVAGLGFSGSRSAFDEDQSSDEGNPLDCRRFLAATEA